MSAQTENAPDTRWFLVDAAQLALMRVACERQHKLANGDLELSAVPNVLGTQYLVKVAGARHWRPPVGLIVRVFTPEDHNEAQAMVRTPEWRRPEIVR